MKTKEEIECVTSFYDYPNPNHIQSSQGEVLVWETDLLLRRGARL